jgi:hypothetical protein
MPIDPADVRRAISDADDFGHEMRVRNLLEVTPAINFEHGGTYKDPITGKPRQFDFRCSLRKQNALLSLAVECKNLSVESPLVISGTWRRDQEAFHDLIESRTGRFESGSMVFVGLSSTTRRSQGGDSFYGPKKFVGKSLLRVKMSKNAPVASPDSDIYDRWSQALASGIDLASEACELSMKLHSPHVFSAILPVVVVANGSLWTVVYDDKGDMLDEPKPAESCELYVGHSLRLRQEPKAFSHQFTFSHVHFFTLSGFDSFLDRMVTNDKAWAVLFNTDAREYR